MRWHFGLGIYVLLVGAGGGGDVISGLWKGVPGRYHGWKSVVQVVSYKPNAEL